ncbi:hypothetical protein ACHAW6_006505 [Cyclotella cf. meneghiniana]
MNISPPATLLSLLLLSTLSTCTAVSITLSPLVFSFRLSSSTTPTSWSSADLTVLSTAAKQYIDGHGLLESALGLSSDDGLQYDGAHFTATQENPRRRFLRATSPQNETDVILSGTVDFTTTSSRSTVLPTAEGLTDVVLALFRNGEALFVRTILSAADGNDGSSEWMTHATGYDVLRSTGGAEVQNIAASRAPSVEEPSYDERGSAMEIYGINLFIFVGAAGAAVSFVLLVAGLCYAKRIHGAADDKNAKNRTRFSTTQKQEQHKTSSILKNHSLTTAASSPSSLPSREPRYPDRDEYPGDVDDDDDESHADFLMARAALNNSHSAIRPHRASGGNASVVSSSCADDSMSYAFSVEGDSVFGGAGAASMAIHATAAGSRAVGDAAIGAGGVSAFRSENGGVFRWNEDKTKMVYIPAPNNDDAHNVKTQNGFIYDETQKKWVLAQKNVSFQRTKHDIDSSLLTTPPRPLRRVNTNDSCITGFTEFSYDDVAANHGNIQRVPSTPHDEGVEVMADDYDDVSEFATNANVERFMLDDESTMFGSVSDGFNDSDTVTVPPPPPPLPPPPPSPLPAPRLLIEPASPDDSRISMRTEEPGIIQRVPNIHEDEPFDEDIPFDERPKRPSSKTESGGDNPRRSASTKEDDGSESEGSADSSRVLNDLNKLSKFMNERKRSSKGSMTRSDSGSNHSRRRSSRK